MRSLSFTDDNHIDLLVCGTAFFPSLIDAIAQAETDIYFETYIFSLDSVGLRVRDALVDAAKRGVVVNVIADWIGTGRRNSSALRAYFEAHGVNYRSFNPWFRRGWARSHRKLCVVDRQCAFVGGINVNDDMFADHPPHHALPAPRWDFAVKVTGPLVAVIYKEMLKQWIKLHSLQLRKRWEIFRENWRTPEITPRGEVQAALVLRDNLRHRRHIEKTLLHALGRARESVYLVNPYFAPGKKLRRGLKQAASRGVKVTLLLGVGEVQIQDAITCYYYPELLKAGVRIVEYHHTQLHAKVAIVDHGWATVGSSNYDGFSLFVNQEANVVVHNTAFVDHLRIEVEHGIALGREVLPDAVMTQPWYRRVWHRLAFEIYRSIIVIIARNVS
jgi:cardiolipin synthase